MIETMKVSQTRSKTIEAATAAALDTAYLDFVKTLAEERIIETHFSLISGGYVIVIIYAVS